MAEKFAEDCGSV